VIHILEDTIFNVEKINEYILVDFLVYNKYIKIKRPITEIDIAEYAIIRS